MEIVRVDLDHPEAPVVERVARALDRGEVVAAPSDTVYGFLARPSRPSAVELLRRIKSRDGPFLVLAEGPAAARRLTAGVPESVWARLASVWPGPLTVILPAASAAGAAASDEGGVAVRVPASAFLIALLRAVGEPLLSTSANRAGEPEPLEAAEVFTNFSAQVELLVDGGRARDPRPSTLVDWRGSEPRLLRLGGWDPAPLLDPGRGGA